MQNWLSSVFVFFGCLCDQGCCDCFYIFDVGQGNCQLAVWEDDKVGVLYDCGTASKQKHVKMSALKRGGWSYIFERNVKQLASTKEVTNITIETLSGLASFTEEASREESGDLVSYSQTSMGDSSKKGDASSLNEAIKAHGLNYLFVILSHQDKDHINLFSKISVSDGLHMMVLCEGDWFRRGTKDTKSVLDSLKKCPNIRVEFPAYWAGLSAINGTEGSSYEDIMRAFRESEDANKFLNLYAGASIIPGLQCSTLYDIVQKVPEWSGLSSLNVLKNVKVAHINFPFKDVNSQSAVVEIKMPKLGMRFFLTGDASEETFARIVEGNRRFFEKGEDYTSLVMRPHHGSKENKTNQLFKLFEPDIIGVSAGNGGKYRHPDKELVDWIERQEYRGEVHLDDNFKSMITYQGKQAFAFENSSRKMPIICTNLLGDIKIYAEQSADEPPNPVFSAKFSSIFEEDKDRGRYGVDFLKHVNVPEFSNREYENKSIQVASDNHYYLCVQYEDKKEKQYLYYPAEKL